MQRVLGSYTLACLPLTLGACGDGGGGGRDDDTATTGITQTSLDESDSSGGPQTESMSVDGTGTDDDTSDTEGECQTVLCGDEGLCCDAGDDCVLGACLPPCDSGVRCGESQDVCCDDGQVCLGTQCETPTGACIDSFDCEIGEFCEPTLGLCLPQLDPVECEVVPDFEEIDVMLEWSYTDEEVISIPVVADIDGDDTPEVVLNLTQLDGASWPGGEIVVLDGATGAEELRVDHDPAVGSYGSHGRSSIGLSDVNGDDLPDIIYAGRAILGGESAIYAIDFNGTVLWESHSGAGVHTFDVNNGAPSFANFDDDNEAEIVFGAALIDNDGLVVHDEGGVGATFGTNANYTGGISALVDLSGDGYPEIVSGQHAWDVDWQAGPTVTVTQRWDSGVPDGYPAIADLDLDGVPEIVLVNSGEVTVLNANGDLLCGIDPTDAACVGDPTLRTQPVALPGGGIGGPPTIADFDGDGRPEIAAAGGGSYSVYDLYRANEDVIVPSGDPLPSLGDLYVRWSQPTQDLSSNATGSSVFDFQGDGVAEVVYADECYMRVYDGFDGTVILEIENSSATIHEYPLVVDVDADGNSEILVVANSTSHSCGAIEGYTPRQGIFAYGDTFDRWVPTRRVWTSHTYHVTNTTSAGNAPVTESDNWTQPNLNNYRQNVQGEGVFNAPDLTIDLAVGLGGCLEGELELLATVRNAGALGVPAGIDVTLYQGTDATGTLIETQQTTEALLPGAQTTVSFTVPSEPGSPAIDYFVTVDGSPDPGTIVECDESNNDAATETAACPNPG